MYKEQSDSKPEEVDTEHIAENTTEEIEDPKKKKTKKTQPQKRKNNISEYLNNNATRNKQ